MKYAAAFFALLLFVSAASADMAPLVSYKTELVNKKYLLVMLYPKENTLNKNNPLDKLYKKSGLYLNDGSRDPIWTLDAPFQGQVFLSADGNFMANVVFPAEPNGEGVRFLHKGKIIRTHLVTDLTRPENIQEACPSCIWHEKVEFNEVEKAIVLESRDGRVWRFDLETGDAVVQSEPLVPRAGVRGVWIAAIAGVVLLAVFLFVMLLGGLLLWKSGWLRKTQQTA